MLQNHVPWRLGTTSFIRAAGWLDNARWLAEHVDDVELLCFEADALPSQDELAGLRALQERSGLSYTVHTPLSASLASQHEPLRVGGIAEVLRVMQHMEVLHPFAYVVHVYLGDREHDPSPPIDHAAWRDRARRSLIALLDSGIAPERLCVESLDYDYVLIEPVLADLGISAALDLGHVHRDGGQVPDLLVRNMHRTRIVQWHGTDPTGRDHRSIGFLPWQTRRSVLEALMQRQYTGVLTLEVFGEADFEASRRLLAEDLARITGASRAADVGAGE